MKNTTLPLFLSIASGLSFVLSANAATVLVFDDFTGTAGSVINATTPDTTVGGASWQARTSGTSAPVFDGAGTAVSHQVGYYAATSFIDLGANYFSVNPGVYTLSMDVTLPSGSNADIYMDLGFLPSDSAADKNLGSNLGKPRINLQQDGEVQVLTDETYPVSSGFTSGSQYNLKLVLDSSVTNWTLDAFVGATQLDLNGGTIGNTYTFVTNPTDLSAVGFGTQGVGDSGASGSATLDNFQLTVIPEPSSALLLGLGALALGCVRRRI